MDEWKDVDGFDGIYRVNKSGDVYSAYINRTLRWLNVGNGYFAVQLYCGKVNGKKKYKLQYIHRLVAMAFIDNPDNFPEVNHKDGNKANNSLDNLEWVTGLQNKRHAIETGLSKKKKKKVIRSDGVVFDSISEAAKSVDGDVSNISKTCRGIWNTAYGYSWSFVANDVDAHS